MHKLTAKVEAVPNEGYCLALYLGKELVAKSASADSEERVASLQRSADLINRAAADNLTPVRR